MDVRICHPVQHRSAREIITRQHVTPRLVASPHSLHPSYSLFATHTRSEPTKSDTAAMSQAIALLPPSTVRALGSGQALTDTVSLVKELIENALDAQATQITVECAPNLLDSVLVRDNGVGIAAADRALAAKRHCTSKLDDAAGLVAVATLGFRGEALASAAELAQQLTLTTRCEDEPVAEAVCVDRAGDVTARRPVAAPRGTCVQVDGFLKHLPVRRANAVRSRAAALVRLRRLLASYYLSRPGCRFTLKIRRGGGGGGGESVVYVPSRSVADAVRAVVGREASAACEWRQTELHGVSLDAFLARPVAAVAAAGVGLLDRNSLCDAYVYVDHRPINCDKRGSMAQQLWKLYKRCVKALARDARPPASPLLYLNIRCPPGSMPPLSPPFSLSRCLCPSEPLSPCPSVPLSPYPHLPPSAPLPVALALADFGSLRCERGAG